MSLRVRNRVTGLWHDVPAGHPALTDGEHDVLRDEPPAPPVVNAATSVAVEPPKRKPAARSRKRKK